MRLDGLYTATDAAINYTLRYLWDEADHNWEQLMNDFETSKYEYRLVNYTTWSVGDNILSKTGVRKSLSYCTNYTLTYPNNLVNLDASDSSLGFLHCGFDPGNTYLTNWTCNRCFITGWSENYFSNLPLKHFHFHGVKGLAPEIQRDKAGKLFSKLPNLKVLDLSNAQIGYFQTQDFFSHNTNLAELYLMDSKLETWNMTITHNSQLKVLDLRNNRIRHIDAKFRDGFTTQHNTTHGIWHCISTARSYRAAIYCQMSHPS